MKTLLLENVKDKVLVDDEDYELLSQYKWWAYGSKRPYAATCNRNGKQKWTTMHRLLMQPPKELEVDHINGNSFDNRRANLRLCTRSQNLQNRRVMSNNQTGFKGVSYDRVNHKYKATIQNDGKQVWLGRFRTAEIAHKVYCEAAIRYYGEFANFG